MGENARARCSERPGVRKSRSEKALEMRLEGGGHTCERMIRCESDPECMSGTVNRLAGAWAIVLGVACACEEQSRLADRRTDENRQPAARSSP